MVICTLPPGLNTLLRSYCVVVVLHNLLSSLPCMGNFLPVLSLRLLHLSSKFRLARSVYSSDHGTISISIGKENY